MSALEESCSLSFIFIHLVQHVLLSFCLCAETQAAVTTPAAGGIAYIDEEEDGASRDEETRSDLDDDTDDDHDKDSGALHINRVDIRKSPRESEGPRLRVCVEITHPALKIPVHRMWTGKTSNCRSAAVDPGPWLGGSQRPKHVCPL